MKFINFCVAVIIGMSISVSMVSCGDDDPDEPQPVMPSTGDGSSGGDQSGVFTDSQIKALISQHVSVTARYSDYLWSFEIKSTLHKVMSDKRIQFGIGHGDVNGTTMVSVEDGAYGYTASTSGNTFIAKFENPFWFYYMFGTDSGRSDAAMCEMYYASYKAVCNKELSNLTAEERDLYNDMAKYFDDYERQANLFYTPSVEVFIDGKKFYTVATYKR